MGENLEKIYRNAIERVIRNKFSEIIKEVHNNQSKFRATIRHYYNKGYFFSNIRIKKTPKGFDIYVQKALLMLYADNIYSFKKRGKSFYVKYKRPPETISEKIKEKLSEDLKEEIQKEVDKIGIQRNIRTN